MSLSVLLVGGLAGYRRGMEAPAGTTLVEEHVYICGDVEEVRREAGTWKPRELRRKYPSNEGWSVASDDTAVVVRKSVDDLCPRHRNVFHLGVFGDRVAIFRGPLGYNGEVTRAGSVPVDRLPPEWRDSLVRAMEFGSQPLQIQEDLRRQLEFVGEHAAFAALDSLED